MHTSLNEEVMSNFRDGDSQAFDRVFNHFFRQICDFSQNVTDNDQVGEEIAMDTFYKLWRQHQNFNTLANIKAFLYITAKNACINFLKHEKVQGARIRKLQEYFSNWEDDCLRSLIETEIVNEIREAVQKLPPMRQQVFKMLFFEEKSPQEVAKELGITVDTVGVHKKKAIDYLKSGPLKRKLLLLLYFIVSLFR